MHENQETFRLANEEMSEAVDVDGNTRIPSSANAPTLTALGVSRATREEFEGAHARSDFYFILRGHQGARPRRSSARTAVSRS